jgi:ABC-type glycerol-3-phosphate transport system substrate-binding protein
MKPGLGITVVTLLSFCRLLATPLLVAQADGGEQIIALAQSFARSSTQGVNVLGPWSGGELKDFQDVVSPWEKETGYTMAFVSTRDLNAVLTTRLEAGDPPP